MRRRGFPIKLYSIFAILLFFFSFQQAFSQDNEPFSINNSPLPAPTGAINDYTGVIDAATKQSLEQKIKELKEKTNPPVELAVAVVRTTGERPIFDYSLAVSRGWGIGSKETDNPGALLFVAIDDRKYFTQVSRDLEDELPDGIVGQLQRQYLVPEFKKANYSKGISDTIDAYIRTIEQRQSGEPVTTVQTEQKQPRGKKGFSICNTVLCLIVLFILMIIIFSGKSRRDKDDDDRWGGGGSGGIGGALPWIIGSILTSGGSSGGSSGSDWGGSSGGDGGWGGFGGGGDFGGGGAGGDW